MLPLDMAGEDPARELTLDELQDIATVCDELDRITSLARAARTVGDLMRADAELMRTAADNLPPTPGGRPGGG
jgi:hypothetical protein